MEYVIATTVSTDRIYLPDGTVIDAQPGSDFYREHCDAVLENVYDSTTVFEQAVKVFFEDLLSLYESKKEKEDHV